MKGATSIQERLWELRKDKGLNLEELSELTGISKSALGSYEKEDYKEINHGNLIALADFYGVSVDYLLCRTENREQINTPLTELHLNDEMVAHDSHNIIVVGVSDEEMEFAVNSLIEQEGGIVLVKDGKVIEQMPMPIAGLMSDQSGEWVDEKLTSIHEKAYTELGICGEVEPVMTLCFMSLAVIPEIKLTDMGLFDVTTFSFIPVEVK